MCFNEIPRYLTSSIWQRWPQSRRRTTCDPARAMISLLTGKSQCTCRKHHRIGPHKRPSRPLSLGLVPENAVGNGDPLLEEFTRFQSQCRLQVTNPASFEVDWTNCDAVEFYDSSSNSISTSFSISIPLSASSASIATFK